MKKAILIIVCSIIFFFEGYAQQKKLLSYDTLKYNNVLEYYCLEKGQTVLDSTQVYYIKEYMIWAKKNFTRKHKGFFYFFVQSDIPVSDSERLAKYELVKKEFLKNGLAENQIKMIDLADPNNHYNMWISGCPNGIMVNVFPHVRKRKHPQLIFCD